MELRHEFSVPASLEETWQAFNDIEAVAVCFPGATVSSVEGDSFKGSCKVKLGPIALVYNGSGTFVEKDESAGRMVLDAKGKDKRGNGTAGAHVTATMTTLGGSTHVEVLTDLSITGKPAQFGRGVMQDVSDKLLGQFTACLENKLGGALAAPPAPEPSTATGSTQAPVPSSAPGYAPVPVPTSEAVPMVPAAQPASVGRSASEPRQRETNRPGNDEALDLGVLVLPVIARAYWKHAVGFLVVLLVLRWLLRRR